MDSRLRGNDGVVKIQGFCESINYEISWILWYIQRKKQNPTLKA